jgi:hypothetical protein
MHSRLCVVTAPVLRAHPVDPKHPAGHLDDAVVLLDAARDAALFEGTPPALGSPSTEVGNCPLHAHEVETG